LSPKNGQKPPKIFEFYPMGPQNWAKAPKIKKKLLLQWAKVLKNGQKPPGIKF
jgi:hypothetical protein